MINRKNAFASPYIPNSVDRIKKISNARAASPDGYCECGYLKATSDNCTSLNKTQKYFTFITVGALSFIYARQMSTQLIKTPSTCTNPNPGDQNHIKNICVHTNPGGTFRFGFTYPHKYARTTRIYLVRAYGHAQIVSGFENIRFRSSTRIRELGGLKIIHSGERFQKDAVSVSRFTGFVWTEDRFA